MSIFRRRILYVPGLLSLSLLFVCCYSYLHYKNAFERKSVLEVNWRNYSFGRGPYIPLPVRNYITYNLTGEEKQDKENLRLAQIEIREQKLQNDTVKGVQLQFGDKAKYWTFVKAFDICSEENIEGYSPFENSILIFNYPKSPEEYPFICGTYDLINNYKSEEELEEERRKNITFLTASFKQYWPSLLLLFSLILLMIKRQKYNP